MPKTKKDASSSSDSDSGPDDRAPPSKKSKDTAKDANKGGSGGDGSENAWVLDKKRQVKINEFRGNKLIDIREYYEKDGKTLPGKKGISLSVSQWKKLLELAKDINRKIDEN